MSWRDISPIRYVRMLPGRALRLAKRVAKPPLRMVLARSRSLLVGVAHRSPWLHARLRRFRYYDHRLRMMFGIGVHMPPSSSSLNDPHVPLKGLPPSGLRNGHNEARKSPLESWFNR